MPLSPTVPDPSTSPPLWVSLLGWLFGAILVGCGGHGQSVERERADLAFVLRSRPQPSPTRLLPAPSERALIAFPEDRLRILEALPPSWIGQVPIPLGEGPQVLVVSEPGALGRVTRHELLAWVEGGEVRGWMPVQELPPGLYRLRDWWLVFDGRWLERARRYPEEAASVRHALERTGRRPDEREIRRHLQAGAELNRDIEAYLVRHGLGLEQAIARTRQVHQEILRQLVGAYFQAFALAAGTLTTARELAPLPEDMAAQTRARARGGLVGTRSSGGAPADEGVPGGAWQSSVVSDKLPSASGATKAWCRRFGRRSPEGEASWVEYQIRHAGPEEVKVQGGGVEIWADGVRFEDGYLIETKWVGQPTRSPYVPGSSFPEDIRPMALEDVEKGFERYAAILHDPSTPVVGLEVITNSREAVPYFRSLMERFRIPGRVVLKP
jgi:hypothetical protein